MPADVGAVPVLLLRGLPLQDRAAELPGHLPEVRSVREDGEAGTALHKPVHRDAGDDQHED